MKDLTSTAVLSSEKTLPVSEQPPPSAPPKVALFDIDGTLVRPDHSIDPRIPPLLLHLERKGISVGFATGRALFGATSILAQIPVNGPSMFFSGSLVCRPQSGEVLFEQGMEHEEIFAIVEEAKRRHVYVELYTRSGYFVEELSPLAHMHGEYMGYLPKVCSFTDLAARQPVLKVVLIGEEGGSSGSTTHACDEVVRKFSHIPCGVSFGAAHPGIVFANFTSVRASRERALDVITEAVRAHRSEVASFGDAAADLEFIERVGFGIAMGNALQEVRGRAQYVTESVEAHGVLPALKWLFSL